MTNASLTNDNIILDSIGIAVCVLTICKTFIFIFMILIRHQMKKSNEKILFILSFNMYMSICIFTLFVLDMFISMLKGHIYSNLFQIYNDTQWCRIKAYLTNVAMLYTLYSNTFHALHRFFRIIYYTNRFLHQNVYLYITGIFIQLVLSLLQPLPLLLAHIYQYEDYHCQIPLTQWFAVIIGSIVIWMPPLSITIGIYMYTLNYIRSNSPMFTHRQQTRIRRDITVIRRVVWSVLFIVLCAIPAFSIPIIYSLFNFFGWWANHLAWLGFVLSFLGMSIVHTYFSPHLRILWARPANRIHTTTVITVANLQ
ncbi:unnamed protein product [Adineta steineri]|uniref:G-protein coupled receptors family 1 profile domain-containing protein n=1 Tax=Adineta steineri TaxID=433720 RepID=A0A814D3J1_9BILA|nr:unnamed protein product [Adineta steineri]